MSRAPVFRDIIGPLSLAAESALLDPYGRGRQWCAAVAAGNVRYVETPGTDISGDNCIVVANAPVGRLRNSFVIVPGNGKGTDLVLTDSTVVAEKARIRARKGVNVIGKKNRVRGCKTTTVKRSINKKRVIRVPSEKKKRVRSVANVD